MVLITKAKLEHLKPDLTNACSKYRELQYMRLRNWSIERFSTTRKTKCILLLRILTMVKKNYRQLSNIILCLTCFYSWVNISMEISERYLKYYPGYIFSCQICFFPSGLGVFVHNAKNVESTINHYVRKKILGLKSRIYIRVTHEEVKVIKLKGAWDLWVMSTLSIEMQNHFLL